MAVSNQITLPDSSPVLAKTRIRLCKTGASSYCVDQSMIFISAICLNRYLKPSTARPVRSPQTRHQHHNPYPERPPVRHAPVPAPLAVRAAHERDGGYEPRRLVDQSPAHVGVRVHDVVLSCDGEQ